MICLREGDELVLPGIASVHSHAFQRALRGRGQRLGAGSNFWSWRETMYRLAATIDPDSMGTIAEFAFAELASLGVTAVGEFHYLHHDVSGAPYGERTIMSQAVIDAARRV